MTTNPNTGHVVTCTCSICRKWPAETKFRVIINRETDRSDHKVIVYARDRNAAVGSAIDRLANRGFDPLFLTLVAVEVVP